MMLKAYTIEYKMQSSGNINEISLLAENKEDAHDKAVYIHIPSKHGAMPYSAWVKSATGNGANETIKKGVN